MRPVDRIGAAERMKKNCFFNAFWNVDHKSWIRFDPNAWDIRSNMARGLPKDETFGGIWNTETRALVFPQLEQGEKIPDSIGPSLQFSRKEYFNVQQYLTIKLTDGAIPLCEKMNLVVKYYNAARDAMNKQMSKAEWQVEDMYDDLAWMCSTIGLILGLISKFGDVESLSRVIEAVSAKNERAERENGISKLF